MAKIGVLFVHGTGVRQEHYKGTFAKFASNLKEYSKNSPSEFHPIECYWAENYPFSNIAPFVEGREHLYAYPSDIEAYWKDLFSDPLSELKRYINKSPQEEIRRELSGVDVGNTVIQELLRQLDIKPDIFDQAQKIVIKFADDNDLKSELKTEVAKAIVAQAIHLSNEKNWLKGFINKLKQRVNLGERLPLEQLDELVKKVDNLLGGFAGEGPLANVKKFFARLGNGYFHFIPFLGDIVRYQGRLGVDIRKEIYKRIEQELPSYDEVIIVAHSLGGIVVLDTLLEKIKENHEFPQKMKLVTVGTQVGLLFGIDGFSTHSKEELSKVDETKLPYWINIYDLDDLLAFPVKPAFGQVIDHQVENPGFSPMTHGQYWDNRTVYEKIIACKGKVKK